MPNEDGTPSAIRENIKYLKRENTLKHIHRYLFCCEEIAAPVVFCVFTSQQHHDLLRGEKSSSKFRIFSLC